MRTPNVLQSATALCLLVLSGALGTGLPSHAHAGGEVPVERDSHVVTADQHSHGTQLVEQDERAASGGPQLAVLSGVVAVAAPVVITFVRAPHTDVLRPTERAPPPGSPRAPPAAV